MAISSLPASSRAFVARITNEVASGGAVIRRGEQERRGDFDPIEGTRPVTLSSQLPEPEATLEHLQATLPLNNLSALRETYAIEPSDLPAPAREIFADADDFARRVASHPGIPEAFLFDGPHGESVFAVWVWTGEGTDVFFTDVEGKVFGELETFFRSDEPDRWSMTTHQDPFADYKKSVGRMGAYGAVPVQPSPDAPTGFNPFDWRDWWGVPTGEAPPQAGQASAEAFNLPSSIWPAGVSTVEEGKASGYGFLPYDYDASVQVREMLGTSEELVKTNVGRKEVWLDESAEAKLLQAATDYVAMSHRSAAEDNALTRTSFRNLGLFEAGTGNLRGFATEVTFRNAESGYTYGATIISAPNGDVIGALEGNAVTFAHP
jgi:hypothetical protein